jgi:hypothetical protein
MRFASQIHDLLSVIFHWLSLIYYIFIYIPQASVACDTTRHGGLLQALVLQLSRVWTPELHGAKRLIEFSWTRAKPDSTVEAYFFLDGPWWHYHTQSDKSQTSRLRWRRDKKRNVKLLAPNGSTTTAFLIMILYTVLCREKSRYVQILYMYDAWKMFVQTRCRTTSTSKLVLVNVLFSSELRDIMVFHPRAFKSSMPHWHCLVTYSIVLVLSPVHSIVSCYIWPILRLLMLPRLGRLRERPECVVYLSASLSHLWDMRPGMRPHGPQTADMAHCMQHIAALHACAVWISLEDVHWHNMTKQSRSVWMLRVHSDNLNVSGLSVPVRCWGGHRW